MTNHPNRSRFPKNASEAFKKGWRACEAGRELFENDYRAATDLPLHLDWAAGFKARGDKGFDVSHLPRLANGAFA